MLIIALTSAQLQHARTLDDDANFVVAGRVIDLGPLAGQHAVPARMIDDPACPPKLAAYLRGQVLQELEPADVFAPDDEA